MLRTAVLALAALALLAGCASANSAPTASPNVSPDVSPSAVALPTVATPKPSRPEEPETPAKPTKPAKRAKRAKPEKPDPRWRFYTTDRHRYTSPWFSGEHRIMIGFGCTPAPYYDHHPGCPGNEGFHHGIDVAMPCGTPLYSDVSGTVLPSSAPGTPGPAYGVNPFRIQVDDRDILIGHTIRVFVHPGEHVRPGQRIALSADSGAPDGCHLHFEVRPHGGGYESAVDPSRLLELTPVR